ncbi:DUF2953 domain-containing protein [Paenibacillus kobensis]|uniref:DUF2953 domain-containing protein n=1 Tax=Paenibacillus kobensis TaxID=59841 RepID=UPI000FDCCE47|nr:DUF2953 domain-containing protein [Paenibacillus kobensis]
MSDFPHGWIWLIAAGFLFVLGLLLWISPIVVTTEMKKVNFNDDLEVHVKALYGLVRLKWRMPVIEWTNRGIKLRSETDNQRGHEETEEQLNAERVVGIANRLNRIVKQIEGIAGLAKQVLRNVKVQQFKWSTLVGTDDAMWTAMATGMLWSVKTTAAGVASQIVHLCAPPELDVQPAYNRMCIESEFRFVAHIRLGQAGIAGIRLVMGIRKLRAGTGSLGRLATKVTE